MKLTALLVPPAVVAATFTAPYLAFAGTLHLICVSLQETHLVHALAPNLTELVPCAAPNPLPLRVTAEPRLPEAGLSFVILGAAGAPPGGDTIRSDLTPWGEAIQAVPSNTCPQACASRLERARH